MNIVTNEMELRKPTEWVKETDSIKQVAEDLFREMKEHQALGLSANQLGYDYRMFVINVKPLPPICIVNPVVVKERGSQVGIEPCFSLPGESVAVKRPYLLKVKGVNQYFKPVKYQFSGLQARVACHEIDHLCGKLIIDYKPLADEIKRLEEVK